MLYYLKSIARNYRDYCQLLLRKHLLLHHEILFPMIKYRHRQQNNLFDKRSLVKIKVNILINDFSFFLSNYLYVMLGITTGVESQDFPHDHEQRIQRRRKNYTVVLFNLIK